MAAGCQPEIVRCLLARLIEEAVISTGWLAGAGGGGFLYLILKPNRYRADVQRIIDADQVGYRVSECASEYNIKIVIMILHIAAIFAHDRSRRCHRH